MRFAVIGTGEASAALIAAGQDMPDFSLACVCSRATGAARRLLDGLGADARIVRDVRALAQDASVDAVFVASAGIARPDQARLLLESGKHVLAARPAARNAADYLRLTAAAREHGVCFVQTARAEQASGFLAAKDALDALGSLRGATLLRGAYEGQAGPSLSAATLAELAYHCAYTAAALFGAPDGVEARHARRGDGLETTGETALRYGAAEVLLRYSRREAIGHGARITCENGTLGIDDLDRPRLVTLTRGDGAREILYEGGGAARDGAGELRRFIEMAAAGETRIDDAAVAAFDITDKIKNATGGDLPMKLPHVGGFIR